MTQVTESKIDDVTNCDVCTKDREFLRRQSRPHYESGAGPLRVADLFCGCGGLTLGLAEAADRLGYATEVRLAVDEDAEVIETFKENFGKHLTETSIRQTKIEALLEGDLGTPSTLTEMELAEETGEIHVLFGGPPCQGHSNLNNHTRRDDPRNALYARMARAAEVLHPAVVLVENVPPVKNDRGGVVDVTKQALEAAGYDCDDTVVNSLGFGVPQRRRRHILLAVSKGRFDPKTLLEKLASPCSAHGSRTVRWAIEGLEDLADTRPFDAPSKPSPKNQERIDWLFAEDRYDLPNDRRPECHHSEHSYLSMYGRLHWDEPAQTVTTGFGSMGQGRYVHSTRPRTITPHEAARLQTFPDFFDFGADRTRSAWARMIGNAVPPLLNLVIGMAIIPLLGLSAPGEALGSPINEARPLASVGD